MTILIRLSPKLLCATAGFLLGLPLITWAQDIAVYTTLYSFAGTDGSSPENLVEGSDGNFYGLTASGGFDYTTGSGGEGYGTFFQITPTSGLTTLYVFAGADDGQGPFGLIKGSEGNFYGLTASGGVNGGGTVFRITPTGELTTLYAAKGYLPANGPLVQDGSGNFYGVSSDDTSDSGSIFRLTPAGVYTTLYKFTGGSDGTGSYGLTRGSDGNFYGVNGSGADGFGTIYQITPAGAFQTLYTFTGGADGAFPNPLTLGPDGHLYGTAQGGGTHSDGVVFRITNAGQYSVLYNFTGGSDSEDPINNLVLGSDGNFYGVTQGTTGPIDPFPTIGQPPTLAPMVPSVFFRVTPQGVFTPLYASATTIGGLLSGDGSGGLIQGSDGNFYGSDNGAETDQTGSTFKLAVVPHPAFFTGQAPLTDGVDYLAFPSGNPFGYYAFLNDPNYLYHFDLGYEYVIDAKDSQGGIYLYDFASSDFFYTSPTFPFPYLYDFNLKSVLYYYPDSNNPGRYNTNGVRYFYDFATGEILTK